MRARTSLEEESRATHWAPVLECGANPAMGWALQVGQQARAVSGRFESVQGAAIRLNPRAAVPVQRNAGSFCVVGGKPCFADGTHWWELTLGTRLT